MLVCSIFSFSKYVFFPIKDRNHNFSNIYLSLANALNLFKSKYMLFGKEGNKGAVTLTLYHRILRFNNQEGD